MKAQSRSSLFRIRLARTAAVVLGGTLPLLFALMTALPVPAALGSPQLTDLQIEKFGPDKAPAGTRITYTLQITNGTGVTLNGIAITDTWTLQDYDGSYESDGGVSVLARTFVTAPVRFVRFDLAPLGPGATGQIRMGMFITSSLQPDVRYAPTVLGNSAYITTSTPGQSSNSDNVNTIVAGPVLQLIPSIRPPLPTDGIRPGQVITLVLTLENKNRSDSLDATNVVISQVLPAYTAFHTATAVAGEGVYSPSANIMFWYVPFVPVGGMTTVTLSLRVHPTTPWGTIFNPRTTCGVVADNLPKVVGCWQDNGFVADHVFEKRTLAETPPTQSFPVSSTFHSRVLTYTVFVYNPFTDTVPGIRVTDTLPNVNSNPAVSFQYLGLVTGTNPPAFVSYSGVQVVWDTPPIAGWGVYSFTFRVWVPPTMPIDPNQVRREYINRLDGSYGAIRLPTNDGLHDFGMRAFVEAQVRIEKVVTPTSQFTGAPVTYTLYLTNTGPTPISNIRLTETLPNNMPACNFQWGGMVTGQAPAFTTFNSAVWTGINLAPYSSWSATFTATVLGTLYANCGNGASAYSPDTYIPQRIGFAPVYIDAPFRYNKTVEPSSVVLGGSIAYHVSEFNIGAVDAVMDGFTDTLPAGFYYGTSPIYADHAGMPLTLLAKQQNAYNTTFPVNVVSTTVACDALPRNVAQDPRTFGMLITSPADLHGFWTNAAAAAPVLVRPQVTLVKTSNRIDFLPGDLVTFTLTLSNNTANPIAGVRVTDTLPSGWTYVAVLPGTAQPVSVTNQFVVWTNQTVPGGGVLSLQFVAALPATPVNSKVGYINSFKADVPTNALICMPRASLYVEIHPPIVEVFKQAPGPKSPLEVTPLGKFRYTISFANKSPYPVVIQRFTETLPGLTSRWRFDSMLSPGDPQPISTAPIVWQNLTIQPFQTFYLNFYARAGTDFGTFPNLWAPPTPPVGAGIMTGTIQQGYTLTVAPGYNGAPVTVIPGVGLDKIVNPSSLVSGEQAIYTVTLVNLSGSTINNVRITDTLPAGFLFDSMLSGAAPLSATAPLVWQIGDVPNGDAGRVTLAFRVTVGISTPTGTYYNRVNATSSSILIPPTDETAPVYVQSAFGPHPDLAISKSDGVATVLAGDLVTYTIAYTNVGDAAATNIVLTETLPASTSFVGPGAWSAAGPPNTYRLPVPDLAPLQFATATLALQISGAAPTGAYTNSVRITATDERITGNNRAIDVDLLRILDLRVSKSDSLGEVAAGQFLTYVINYTNAGNETIANVLLTDTLGTGLVRVGRDWGSVGGAVFTRSIGTLDAGQSGTVLFIAQVDPSVVGGSALTNTVVIGFPGVDSHPADNNSTDVDTVSFADLRLWLDDDVALVLPGQTFTYTFRYANIGGATAGGAVLTATIAPLLSVIAAPGWSADPAGYVLPIGDLGLGMTGTASIVVQAPGGLTADTRLTTTGVLSGEGDITPANNFALDVDSVQNAGPDLRITGASAGNAVAGFPATVIVTVTNAGNGPTPDWFFVDLYVNRRPLDRTDLGDAWGTAGAAPARPARVRVAASIGPGESRQVAFQVTPATEGNHELYAQADTCDSSSVGPGLNCYDLSYGRVAETNEGNNIGGPFVIIVSPPLELYLPIIRR